MVMMQLCPLSLGRGPMKSMVILSPQALGTGKGYRGPAGACEEDLLHWQLEQDGM